MILKALFFISMLTFAVLPACLNPKDTPQTTPQAELIDSLTMERLKTCVKFRTDVTIDSCEWFVSPYWGETVGLDYYHKPTCKNPKH